MGSVTGDEEVAGVLRVDPAVAADRRRGVGGAEGELLEDLLLQRAALVDGEKVAVFAVRIDDAVAVDDEGVDAPLEAERVIADAGDVAEGVAGAAQGIGVLIAPLDVEVVIELRDEVLLGVTGIRGVAVGRADRVVVAIGADAAVVVVFGDDGVRGVALIIVVSLRVVVIIVLVDARGDVPAEFVRSEVVAVGGEVQEMSLGVIVTGVGAEEDRAVGGDNRVAEESSRMRPPPAVFVDGSTPRFAPARQPPGAPLAGSWPPEE